MEFFQQSAHDCRAVRLSEMSIHLSMGTALVPVASLTFMEPTWIKVSNVKLNPSVSFTLSEASLPSVCSASPLKACTADNGRGDPELPVCARLTMYVLL